MEKYSYLSNPGFVVKNTDWYFKEGLTWNDVAGERFNARYTPEGYIFADASPSFFPNIDGVWEYLGYFNSKVFQHFADTICQGLHYSTGQIPKIPCIQMPEEVRNISRKLSRANYNILEKQNHFKETSWDFSHSPLTQKGQSIQLAFESWSDECNKDFEEIKDNDETLNNTFILLYGLESELQETEDEKDVASHLATYKEEIKDLISYAVGCMFGRYSLDVDGLAYAGGDWDDSKYTTFQPDADNVIPITDARYMKDDIVDRFCEWLTAAYGAGTLEENLDFIAKGLGTKGTDSRDIIRNYFLNDFFKDHCQTYSVTGSGKRPIYWLFDSGKQNGFKALVYMHRYNADTIGRVRVSYLHPLQEKYENEVRSIDTMLAAMKDQRQIAVEERRKEKLAKQIAEVKEYDEKLDHLAQERIEIDLDDGVKVNYEKIQTDREGKKYQILAPIK